jgi:hypothetical protein
MSELGHFVITPMICSEQTQAAIARPPTAHGHYDAQKVGAISKQIVGHFANRSAERQGHAAQFGRCESDLIGLRDAASTIAGFIW